MTVPVAFAAGIAAFFSPCVLPLLPVYLAYLSGSRAESKKELARNLLLFTAGFALVFTALGASASALGQFLFRYQPVLTRLAGAILIIFGLQMMEVLRIPFLHRQLKLRIAPAQNPLGYFLLGVVLALGWTPCIGMMLASILMMAGSMETVYQGMLLLFVFSLGFALPFFAAGLLIGAKPMGRISHKAARLIQKVAGIVLTIMGLLLIFDLWLWLQSLFA